MKAPVLLLALLPLAAWAQAPTLNTVSPGRNATAAPRLGPINLTFSGPVTGAANLRVQSSMWHGQRTGAASGDGTATLGFQPTRVFAPGERVSVSVPATVRGAGTGGAPLATGQVLQFRAVAGPGLGSFTAGTSIVSMNGGPYFRDPALADMNADGNLDLLYHDPTANRVFLRPGDGQGGFGAATNIFTTWPEQVFLADFNNDGKLDIVSFDPGSGTRTINFLMGNGQGGVSGGTQLTVVLPTFYIEPGDVNADGNLDLVFMEINGGNALLGVRLGDGQGNFTASASVPLLSTANGLRLADVNNDGYLDCLVSNNPLGQLNTYLGNGRGSFARASTPPVPVPMSSFAVNYLSALPPPDDFNGDGILDLLVRDPDNNAVRLHLGTGQGGFGAPTVLTLPNLQLVHAADLDGDSDLDLLGTVGFSTSGSRIIAHWANNGNGTFTAQPPIASPATRLVTGDLNNDGAADVVALDERGTGSGYGIYTQLNQALTAAPTLTSFTPAVAPAGTVVTLTGINFTGATAVLVGGVPVTGFTVVNGTTITFTVPAGSPTGLVSVLSPAGQGTAPTALRNGLATHASANTLPVQLWPNPAHGTVQLQLPAGTGLVRAQLYNSLGQLVQEASVLPAGNHATLDVSRQAPGLYSLRLQAGQHTAVQQLVVE